MRKSHEEEVLEDIHKIDHKEFHEHVKTHSWIWKLIIGLFMISILFIFFVPYYSLRFDPNPKDVEKIDFKFDEIPERLDRIDEIHLRETTSGVRQAAIQIGTAVMEDIEVFSKIKKGVNTYLKQKGHKSVDDIIGFAGGTK